MCNPFFYEASTISIIFPATGASSQITVPVFSVQGNYTLAMPATGDSSEAGTFVIIAPPVTLDVNFYDDDTPLSAFTTETFAEINGTPDMKLHITGHYPYTAIGNQADEQNAIANGLYHPFAQKDGSDTVFAIMRRDQKNVNMGASLDKFSHLTNTFAGKVDIASGTSDIDNHPAKITINPADSRYLFFSEIKHRDDILIYKSNSAGSLATSLIYQYDDDNFPLEGFAYPIVQKVTGGNLYLCTQKGFLELAVSESTDSGLTWTPRHIYMDWVGVGGADRVYAQHVNKAVDGKICVVAMEFKSGVWESAGLMISQDGGDTWENIESLKSLSGAFSKDTTVAPVTNGEFYTNFAFVDERTDPDGLGQTVSCLTANNVFYGVNWVPDGSTLQVWKHDTVWERFDLTLPDFQAHDIVPFSVFAASELSSLPRLQQSIAGIFAHSDTELDLFVWVQPLAGIDPSIKHNQVAMYSSSDGLQTLKFVGMLNGNDIQSLKFGYTQGWQAISDEFMIANDSARGAYADIYFFKLEKVV